MPVEVLHILGTAEAAGASIAGLVRTLATQLDPEEYHLTTCFLGQSGPWTTILGDVGSEVFEIPWPSPMDLVGAFRFWRFLRARRVDLLHVHYGGRSVRKLARLTTRAPLVVHLHGYVTSEADHRPVSLDLNYADAVIATSQAVANVVRSGHVKVVYPGVRLERSERTRDTRTIGAAGRLVAIKGYKYLLEAFAAVRAVCPSISLEIAGDGPCRDELESQARFLQIDDAVTFLGWCDNLPERMLRWSLFVQPSMEEALGITVLQAMASGLPVIASDVGGLPEIVENGVTGLLVPPGDVSLLSAALKDLLSLPDRCRQLGEAARESTEQFSEARFAAGVCEVYEELLRPRSEACSP